MRGFNPVGALAIGALMLLSPGTALPEDAPRVRDFEFIYTGFVKDIPAEARAIDLWMPIPSDTYGQVIHKLTVTEPSHAAIGTEPRYGNRMVHASFEGPFDENNPPQIVVVIEARRTEIIVPEAKAARKVSIAPEEAPASDADVGFGVYLEPNALIPRTDRITGIVRDLALADKPPIHAARAVYDYLLDSMVYNWRAEGAGRGDMVWACDSRTGDCTDYSSMFIALCRERGIPADHMFGFPFPRERSEGRLLSYHCWTRFHAPGVGWIPLDTSLSDKHPEDTEYNFGSLTESQLIVSHGRDVELVPRQQGEPLNYFIYPYAEIDGAPVPKAGWKATFRDIQTER